VRQVHARGVARRRIGIEDEILAAVDFGPVVLEAAEPELRPLQIDENADRPIAFRFNLADRRHQLTHLLVRGVTHIDAEDVRAGLEQAANDDAARRSRPERRHDLGAPPTPHLPWLPGASGGPLARTPAGGGASGLPERSGCCGDCSLVSVSWTVQARCSPVSTSKKPLRS